MVDKNKEYTRAQEEKATQSRARMIGARYLDTRGLSYSPVQNAVLNKSEMYKSRIAILTQTEHELDLGITINSPRNVLRELKQRFSDYQIHYKLISDSGFDDIMNIVDPHVKKEMADIELGEEKTRQNFDIQTEFLGLNGEDMLDYMLAQALKLRATDIHIEHIEENVRLRYRVDGVLHTILQMPHDSYRLLESSLAIAADIGANVPVSQTGHMLKTVTTPDGQIDLNARIETVPTLDGQDLVMRLFVLDEDLLDLEKLGFNTETHKEISEVLKHPHGMVLVVGPTGSGKTTTLYSMINSLNTEDKKIVTLEDPVEFSFKGVTQIPVDTTDREAFMMGLRSVMRLDPDVIMVGEIRDIDTARAAIHAALTGHLVLATFHADDTVTALMRMKDMVGDNPLFSNALRLVIGQRLVRKVQSTEKGPVPQIYRDKLSELLASSVDLSQAQVPFFNKDSTTELEFYNGRTVISEHLSMTPEIVEALTKNQVTHEDLIEAGATKGTDQIKRQGILKALEGKTTIEEVYRVIG